MLQMFVMLVFTIGLYNLLMRGLGIIAGGNHVPVANALTLSLHSNAAAGADSVKGNFPHAA